MSKTKARWSLVIIIFILLTVGVVYYFGGSSFALFTDDVMGENTIELSVSNEIDCINNPNSPELTSNMIPVSFDDSLKVWKIANKNNSGFSWYNYCEKKWANVVTVTDSTKYTEKQVGTIINNEDINAMFVWIPRFKYQIFNYNYDGTSSFKPDKIPLAFEQNSKSTGDITCKLNENGVEVCSYEKTCMNNDCNDKTYTHPGFNKFNGFWVSKFELTGDLKNITSVPVDFSIREASIRDFNDAISNMNNKNNPYGFEEDTKIYMINNLQWGAISYLSSSKYGNGSEMGINNCDKFLTGIGAPTSKVSEITCNNNDNLYYGNEGVKASTTGNVYGVYDMSGGSSEFVLGALSESGNLVPGLSGYTSSEKVDNLNLYRNTNLSTDLSISKLGDGIREVKNDNFSWNSDFNYVAYDKWPWFLRGGSNKDEKGAGLFSSSYTSGTASDDTSTRVIIVK